jgi:hypothetical protein
MRRIEDRVIDKALKAIRTRRVVTVSDTAGLLQASLRTARRMLSQWNAYRSYNQNGRYYVLPEVARFDADGLWRHREIGFSRYGNLTQTLIGVVHNSSTGLGAAELGGLLGMQPHGFLSLFREHPALRRKKYRGRFVYFSADAVRYAEQSKVRQDSARSAELPGDAEAVAILAAAIKHPGLNAGQLCRQLETQAVVSTPQRIENLFAHHNLCLKKTPPSDS